MMASTEQTQQQPEIKKVCVTGASGYVATHIVKLLLEKGYFVTGTVRDTSNVKKTSTLNKIAMELGAVDHLNLVEADLLKEGSFDSAVEGCDAVLHTASPFKFGSDGDPYEELINPAVKGVENVMNACIRSTTVKRVVMTSSVVAIYGRNDDKDIPFTEADWNTSSTVEESPYYVSKTRAEKKAWDMSKQQAQFTLVTIHPGMVMGPTLTGRSDSTSVSFMQDLVGGKMKHGAPDLHFGIVDVRDVAVGHVKLMENQNAEGRHICCAGSKSLLDIAELLRPTYGEKYSLPKHKIPKWTTWLFGPWMMGMSRKAIKHNVGIPLEFDNSKMRSKLGMEFRDIQTTVNDMVKSMEEHNLLADHEKNN